MGKTQIALEYAFSRQSNFDAISFSIVMQWLVDPFKPVPRSGPGEKTRPSSEASWLIIFDNVDMMELISEFWPATGSGSVLITTRDTAGKDFCNDRGTILAPLPFSEAVDLFASLLNLDPEARRDRESELVPLLERFGGLPLAIVQIVSLIQRRFMTIPFDGKSYSLRGRWPSHLRVIRRANLNPKQMLGLMVPGVPWKQPKTLGGEACKRENVLFAIKWDK